jgi:lipopolysaccharide biosynthesis protein
MKAIAIHLPQFHPFPENDSWWGKGFTEWSNVAKATPRFKGHYQPHIPADLGFYDLRLEEARVAQAELARSHGIHGFCYYHYWFNGKRLLNRPLDDMLKTKTPDFPFMLCWANENWTRRWDGLDHEILMKQDYSEQDDEDHIRFLCQHFFSDQRYIRVNGKPFFVVYRPELIPHISRTIEIWRSAALKLGIGEIYIGYMHQQWTDPNMEKVGFDCSIEFQPDIGDASPQLGPSLLDRGLNKLGIYKSITLTNTFYSYEQYAQKMMERKLVSNRYPGITPMWDNSARRLTGATIFKDSKPEMYKRWLHHIVGEYKKSPAENKFIFINAWNEWAEGNHLEPCQRWGLEYLKATKEVMGNV